MPRSDHRSTWWPFVVIALSAAAVLASPTPAWAADQPTTIAFESPSQTTGFGSDWFATIHVTTQYGQVAENAGTVDVYVDGGATPFAGGVAIHPGGEVFVTQPAATEPLAAGAHSLTAIFRPAAGSGLATSQTATPLSLTVTPLDLQASARLVTTGREPVVRVSLAGAYVEALGTPAGEWSLTATGTNGQTPIERRVPQSAGAGASLDIALGEVTPGSRLSITTRFIPGVGESGGTIAQPSVLHYTVPALTAVEIVSTPVPAPLWAVILAACIVLGGAVALVLQSVRLARSRRTPPISGEESESTTASVAE